MEYLLTRKKAIAALIIGVLQVASVYLMLSSDGLVSPTDWQAIINTVILALGGTIAVERVTNKK